MILFSYTPTYTTVKCNLIEKREIKRLISARPDGYMFAPKFKKGWWDGYISLLDKQNRFPSGLLNYILAQLDDSNFDYDVTGYEETSFSFQEPKIPNYTFRPYQLEAVKQAILCQRGVLKMATNAGKTLVAAGIIQLTGCKAVVIVPNKALLIQTANELESMLGIKIGQYGGGVNDKRNVTVTTMASLSKLIKQDLDDNITIINDEVHHSSSDQVFDCIFSIPATFRIGMSGTPLKHTRLADLKLVGATGDIIYEVTNTELIVGGYSSKPAIKFHKITEPKLPAKTDYQTVYWAGIVDNKVRNELIANIAKQEQKRGPVLIICNWVEHVNNIASLDSSFLSATGNTSKVELETLLQTYNESNDVLVVSPIFGEGVNIPSVATVIMASGNKSHIQILQRIGRGLRKTEDKDVVHVYDFIDACHKYLLKHSDERYKLYKEEGFSMEMIQ
jgi:superfamily II DNA or RNA helicase